jgi:hypothetical protein
MGLVPEATRVGDSVAILLGGQMLYILRHSGAEAGRFRLVSEGYIHIMMDGEAMELVESNECSIKKIVME